jgi:hypothetical protein
MPLLVGLVLVTTGCREIQISTTVHADGSVERTFVVESDSSGMGETAYPIPRDASWEQRSALNEDDEEGDAFFYTISKKLKRARDLEEELHEAAGAGLGYRPLIEISRRHRWFTTFLTYRERHEAFFPFRRIPISEYLTPEEIESLKGEETDEAVEEQVMEWQFRNIFEELFLLMLEGAGRVSAPDLTVEGLEAGKERMWEVLIPAAEEAEDEELVEVILSISGQVYETEAVMQLRPEVEEFDRILNEYMEFDSVASGESYKYTVEMPGLIVDTNSEEIKGNTVSWEFDADDLNYADYEMWVEARVTNRTAIWLVAGLLAVVVVLAAVTLVRRM